MSTIGKVSIDITAENAKFSTSTQAAGKDADRLAEKLEHLKKQGGSEVFEKLREGLGRRSALGEATELIAGGGGRVLGGLTGAADAIKEMATKAGELREQFESGKLSAGELTEKLIQGVPVIGQFWTAGRAIRELFDADAQALAGANEQAKILDTALKSSHELVSLMAKETHDLDTYLEDAAKEMAKLTLNSQQAERAIADITLKQQLENIEVEKKAKIKAAEDAAKPAIDAARKAREALQPGDESGKLTTWEELTTSNGEALEAHRQRALDAQTAAAAERNVAKLRDQAIAQAEADAATKADTARKLAAQRAISSGKEAAAKQKDEATKDNQAIADLQAEAAQTLLQAAGKKYEAELVGLRAALAKKLAEIHAEALAEVKARGEYTEEINDREDAKSQAATDLESAKELAARKEEQNRQEQKAQEALTDAMAGQKAMEEEALRLKQESLTAVEKYREQMDKIVALKDAGLISDKTAADAVDKAGKEYSAAHQFHDNAGAAETRRFDFNVGRVSQAANPIDRMVQEQKETKKLNERMAQNLDLLQRYAQTADQDRDETIDF